MKKQKPKQFQRPRGTHDILPEAQYYWDKIYSEIKQLSIFYGFGKLDTPHFEDTELFNHSVGDGTDIVEKQMYSFKTRGGDALTLRPEGTASAIRAYIENGMIAQPHPVKLWYLGSFFRHESPQRGRFREFHQWGLETIGEDGPVAEAEMIQMAGAFFREVGLKDYFVELNSIGCPDCRGHIKSQILAYYRNKTKKLCMNCRKRMKTNYFRLFDCKEEKCVQLRQNAPQILDQICDACRTHFKSLLEFMDEIQFPYTLNPYLVRGLDYYSRSVFEFFVGKPEAEPASQSESGEKSEEKEKIEKPEELPAKSHFALGGGGRYDGLVEKLGGRPTAAVGIAIGIERVIEIMRQQKVKMKLEQPIKVFLVQLGEMAKRKSLKILEQFRTVGISIRTSLGKNSIKTQFGIALKAGAEFVLIFGQKEALDGEIIVREMSSGIQETVPLSKVVEAVKRRIHK